VERALLIDPPARLMVSVTRLRRPTYSNSGGGTDYGT